MSQLRQHGAELTARGVQVCVVTFEAGPLAMAYVRDTELNWPLLVDRDRSLYRAYSMERGSFWQIFGLSPLLAYLKLLIRGRRLQPAGSDVRQLGGDVLIDPEGVVRLHWVGAGPADRPPMAALLQPLGE